MNGREALKALADGKTIHSPSLSCLLFRLNGCSLYSLLPGDEVGHVSGMGLDGVIGRDNWQLYEEPLTDEQLVAEWEESANQERSMPGLVETQQLANAYRKCARQLKERKL
jgi:hypothetical protein